MFKASTLYEVNYNCQAQIVVNQGGTSSGKTYSILQVIFTILSQHENWIATVVGQDIPNLKAGALRDALDIYNNSKILQSLIRDYNKTDRIFTFNNGSVLEFKSYDNSQDAKSGKRHILFINEANGIHYNVYEELSLRTKVREFIDYNPNAEFWVHESLIGKPNVQLFISDHRHNPFISYLQRQKIEALKEKDIELWKVYARGMTGKIEGLIFRNWSIVDELPKDAKFVGTGLDFGFTNDVTAIPIVFMQNGELYIDELVYESCLTNPDICKKLDGLKYDKRLDLIADSSEPKSIEEIRRFGYRIEAAMKGPDSVNNSIDILKRYHWNVTRRSVNLRKELNNYKWKVDKATGKPLNEPVDAFNHAIDAVRYVGLNRLAQKSTGRIRTTI
jgi:phage terminase large subunit